MMKQVNSLKFEGCYKRIISIVLCVILSLVFCACNGSAQNEPSKEPVSSETSSKEDTTQSQVQDTSSTESTPEENTESSEDTSSIDPLSGDMTTSTSLEEKEDDAEIPEESVQVYSPNLMYSLKGYADKEADARRMEILNTPNTEELYEIKGTKYYISYKGSNMNDGLSESTPFKDIDALREIELKPGDAVLFERGGVYRFKRTIAVQEEVTYGSYGTGNKPAIYGSPINVAKSTWLPYKKENVWYVDCNYGAPSGIFIDHGKEIGKLKGAGINLLTSNGDFHYNADSGEIYLYCDEGNPGLVYESIEVSPSYSVFHVSVDNVVIDNICIKYSAYGITMGDRRNVSVTNCEFGYIGGKVGAASRRGNAIEIYPGSGIDIKFDHNWIYQTFDSAITWQGFTGEECEYTNVSFSDNLLEYNNADIEVWDQGYAKLDNFKMNNNIMRFTSMSWGTQANNNGPRGIEGVLFGHLAPLNIVSDIQFMNNIIDCPARQIICLDNTVEQRKFMKTENNKYYVNGSYRTMELAFERYVDEFGTRSKDKVHNLEELKNAMTKFDPSGEYYWFDK